MTSPAPQALAYTALERLRVPRPVDRLDWMSKQAEGQFVFDLGALDETAYGSKQHSNTWLHARIASKAREVVGMDNSPLVPQDGLVTGPNSRIVNRNIFDLQPAVLEFGAPDLVIAGELIEHLPDAGAFLQAFRAVDALRPATFIMSTPNAASWHNAIIGLASMESTHKDHLAIYSYKVLHTLFSRNGFEILEMRPYHATFQEMLAASAPPTKAAVLAFEKTVNVLEMLAPVLSAGWIVKARIKH